MGLIAGDGAERRRPVATLDRGLSARLEALGAAVVRRPFGPPETNGRRVIRPR